MNGQKPDRNQLYDWWITDKIPPEVLQKVNVPPYREWEQTQPRKPSLWERATPWKEEAGETFGGEVKERLGGVGEWTRKRFRPTEEELKDYKLKPWEKTQPIPEEWQMEPLLEKAEMATGKALTYLGRGGLRPPWEKPVPELGEREGVIPYEEYKEEKPVQAGLAEALMPGYFLAPGGAKGAKAAEQFVTSQLKKGTLFNDIVKGLAKFKVGEKEAPEFIINVSKKIEQVAPKAAEGMAKGEVPIKLIEKYKDGSVVAVAGHSILPSKATIADLQFSISYYKSELAKRLKHPDLPIDEQAKLLGKMRLAEEELAKRTSGVLPKATEGVPPVSGTVPPTTPPKPPIKPPVRPPGTEAVPPTESTLDKFRRALSEAEPLGKKSEKMIAAERKVRTAESIAAEEAAGGGEKGLYAGLAKAKGAMERPEFEAVRKHFTDAEVDELIRMPDKFLKPDGKPLQYWEGVTVKKAFLKLMNEGKVPEPKELEWLKKVYGEDIVEAAVKHIKAGTWMKILDVLGIPRAIQTSLDLSYWLRQGGPLVLRHPGRGIKNLGQGAKSFVTEKNALTLDDAVRQNPWYELATTMERPEATRLFLPQWGSRAMKLAQRQEEFMTSAFGKKFAKFLGLAQSERAFVTGLNKLKMDEFAYLMDKATQLGLDIEKLAGPTAAYLNILTGRGNLGRQLNSIAPILNQMFYSARLQISRLQLGPLILKRALKGSKTVEERFLLKEMTKTLAAWYALTMGFLTAGVVIGGGKVEMNPLSTDQGKLKIGNTRIDPWGGYQQWFRFFAQLATGYRKETATGGYKQINRGELVERFLRGKASPQAGLLADLLFDETVIGEEMTASWEGLGQQVKNRLLAFTIMDFRDAMEQEGLIGALYAAPSIFGYGVLSYADPLIEKEGQLGDIDDEGNIYSLSTFGGDISRYSGVGGKKGTPLVQFYFKSNKLWGDKDKPGTYYATPVGTPRYDYRKTHPEVDATLFFWGRVTTFQSTKAENYVKQWMTQYGIPPGAIRGYQEKETVTPTPPVTSPPRDGGLPKRTTVPRKGALPRR